MTTIGGISILSFCFWILLQHHAQHVAKMVVFQFTTEPSATIGITPFACQVQRFCIHIRVTQMLHVEHPVPWEERVTVGSKVRDTCMVFAWLYP